MKTLRHGFALIGIATTLWLPRAHPEEARSASGTIEGRVFNAVTGTALPNARLTVEGTGRQTITDPSGSYRLSGLPVGRRVVSVLYVGMAPQKAELEVVAGSAVQHEFQLTLEGARPGDAAVVQLQEFKVVEASEMSAQALAMNEQRFAPNLKNVVALDEFGDRGHENLGEFLHFLPGVAVDVPGDSGPATVSLRGMPANHSGVTIDGATVSGARGNSREVDMHDVAMGNVSRVEITKVPTPDMPASGLGGSINLITKSGFESRKPVFSYQVYTLFNSSNGLTFDAGRRNQTDAISPDWVQPSFNLTYLRPVNKKFALSLGVSRTWRMKSHGDSSRDEIPTWNLINGFQRTSAWQAPVQLYTSVAGQIGFDWRVGDKGTLSAGYQQKKFSMRVHRSRFDVNYGVGATGNAEFTQGASTGVGTATQGTGTEYEHMPSNRHFNLKYRHQADAWRIDASGSYAIAKYNRADIDKGYFRTVPATIPNLIIRGEGIPAGGGVPTRYRATTRTGAPADVYNGAQYSINTATSSRAANRTLNAGGRLDFTREFRSGVPFDLKVGAATDWSERDQKAFPLTWNFRPNGATDVESRLAGRFDVFDEAFLATAPTAFGVPVRDISMRKTYELFQKNPQWFVLDEPAAYQSLVTSSRRFEEQVSAAYLRGDFRLFKHRLWLVTGARFERTDVKGWGPLDDINAQYQRRPDGSFVRNAAGQRVLITSDALALRKLRYRERAATGGASYDGIYPSLNASYNVSDHVVLRAAYARTIGRPDVEFVTPGTTISEPDVVNPTVTVSNPGLNPWTADNFDLSLESYNFKDAFGSIGVFRKDINNFFGEVLTPATPELIDLYQLPDDGSLLNYNIVTMRNAGKARISGLEFNYRQNLSFLPPWARGLQVFFNATKLRLEGDATADFSGFNPSKVAGGVNLIRAKYFIKVTYSYQGETRRASVAANAANGIPAGTYNYQGERTRWGVSVQYSLSRKLSLYGSIMDIGGFEVLTRQYAASTPEYARGSRIQDLGYYTTLGVKGSF